MSLVNYATREITCKIVYYGPGRSGKTTNLHYIYGQVPEDRKGKMVYSLVSEKSLRVSCPLHYSTFDLETGKVVGGPACNPLQVKPLPEPR